MLVVAATVFHCAGHTGAGAAIGIGIGIGTLSQAYNGLGTTLGRAAATAFAVVLPAAGLASSSVDTYTGQIIMEGFPQRRIPLAAERAATLIPAAGLLTAGLEPPRALALSQVALSFGIPFARSADRFTSGRRRMGGLVDQPLTIVAAIAATGLIIGLNLFLLIETLCG